MRITSDLWHRLDHHARASGRSLSAEAEFRLERSFQEQDLLDQVLTLAYGRQTAGLVEALGRTIWETVFAASRPAKSLVQSEDWLSDPRVFAAVEEAVDIIFECLRPAGDAEPPLIVHFPLGLGPLGPAVANTVLRYIIFGSADSGDELARLGARLRGKLGPEATQYLRAALEQAPQPEANQ
jgi:hypothetical protein